MQPSSEFFQLPAVVSSPQLRQTIINGLGTVTHGFIVAAGSQPIPKPVVDNIKHQVVRELTELITNSPFPEDKATVMAAIGNCGIPEFIPIIQRLVEDPSVDKEVRIGAIIATRRMPIALARKVREREDRNIFSICWM